MSRTLRGAVITVLLATGLIITVAVAAEDVGCAVRRLPEQGPATFTMEVDISALTRRKVVITRSNNIPNGHSIQARVGAAASRARCAATAGASQRLLVSVKGPWAEIAVTQVEDVHVIFRDRENAVRSAKLQAGSAPTRTFQF